MPWRITDQVGLPWRFSAAWLNKHLNCTPEGIRGSEGKPGCGSCCVDYHPGKAWPGFPICPFYLKGEGCSLTPKDRPVICLLAPLTVQEKHDVRNIRVSWTAPFRMCKNCWGEGPRIVETHKECLTALFGEEGYAMILRGCDTGADPLVYMLPDAERAFLQECLEMEIPRDPIPRSQRVYTDPVEGRVFNGAFNAVERDK